VQGNESSKDRVDISPKSEPYTIQLEADARHLTRVRRCLLSAEEEIEDPFGDSKGDTFSMVAS
jgi:hypothetical protein